VERNVHPQLDCPRCGSSTVATKMERDTFTYGTETGAPELSALVPVRVCTTCGFKYMDEAAEEARHEAICRHLGISTGI
jgi:YgiT-type zinc finger domain-containing protein